MKSRVRQQIAKAKRNGVDMIQLAAIRESARKHSEALLQEATDKAILVNLVITCEILANDYWEKSAKKRIPEFVAKYLGLLEAFQMEVVDWQQILDDLHDITGLDFEAEWVKNENKSK